MKTKKTSTDLSYATSLGLMYRRFVLDCISDLGHAVSQDFSLRPHLYPGVHPETAKLMSILQASKGDQAYLPDKKTRDMLYKPIFGTSDATGTGNDGSVYQAGRLKLITSAALYAENSQASGHASHRATVRSARIPLNHHFTIFKGASITESSLRTKGIFEMATKIITDDAVRGVFGITKAIDPEWPLVSDDSQGAILVENITMELQGLIPAGQISSVHLIRLQRMGEEGAAAIKLILNQDVKTNDTILDLLMAHLYAWGSELGLIGTA